MDDSQLITKAKAEISWLKAHERIVIVFLVLAVGLWLGNKWLDNSAADTKTKLTIALQAKDEAALQAAQAANQYQMTIDALTKQNAALAGAVASRQVILEQKQEAIKTQPLPEVVAEWQRLIGGAGDIVQRIDGTSGASISEDGARRTTSMLEAVPVLTASLADTNKIVANQKEELAKADTLVGSLNQQITANGVASKAEIAAVKAAARKSKRNWFVAGFISGIATRILFKF
jgi:hypothetical protein